MSTLAIVLIVLGFILTLLAVAGSVLPILPGPPLGVLGVLLLDVSTEQFHVGVFLWVFLIALMLIGIVVDYVIPAMMVRFFGGTKKGSLGSTVGQVAGLYYGLLGSIIGAFLGTFVGEKIAQRDWKESLKSGLGSTLGFVISSVVKVFISLAILLIFVFVFFRGI